jgi:hypothetical protein
MHKGSQYVRYALACRPGPKESDANLNDKLKHIGHFYSMPAAIASA